MKFKAYIDALTPDALTPDVSIQETQEIQVPSNDNAYYWNILDEDTGFRFDIPMLNSTSGTYFYQYISYMKLRERSEETFNKIMNWD